MRMGSHRYQGDEIAVTYEVKRCIHATECVRGLPSVFDPERRPWVRLEGASAEEVVRVVERCPTGALRYERSDGTVEAAALVNEVTPSPDGPLYARGEIVLQDALGMEIARELRLALCRCGGSANKPYCDGQHRKLGFSDPGEVPPPPVPSAAATAAAGGPVGGAPGGAVAGVSAPAAPGTGATAPGAARLLGGALHIILTKNGPLRLLGPVVVRSTATGVACPAQRLSLCRCGGSQNKPYCDGSHGRIGFEA
ncbi:MAG TPA: CDGSH iron-sulfur domain-containing protein [Candidatus Krumholzibacteria bacterium]|nr:CDGSH iron-sulfur domain-containing protein [Candidatus Krumholzibacteria bacterium]